jgi:hypothetical protein
MERAKPFLFKNIIKKEIFATFRSIYFFFLDFVLY